jgi:hypothetical protein
MGGKTAAYYRNAGGKRKKKHGEKAERNGYVSEEVERLS